MNHAEQMAKIACLVQENPELKPHIKRAFSPGMGAAVGGLAGAGILGGLGALRGKKRRDIINDSLIGGLAGGAAGAGFGHFSTLGAAAKPGGGISEGVDTAYTNLTSPDQARIQFENGKLSPPGAEVPSTRVAPRAPFTGNDATSKVVGTVAGEAVPAYLASKIPLLGWGTYLANKWYDTSNRQTANRVANAAVSTVANPAVTPK